MTTLDRFIVVPFQKLVDEPVRDITFVAPKKKSTPPINPVGRSGIRGVHFKAGRDLAKPWFALAKVDGRLKHLGYFATREEAARAREAFLSGLYA